MSYTADLSFSSCAQIVHGLDEGPCSSALAHGSEPATQPPRPNPEVGSRREGVRAEPLLVRGRGRGRAAAAAARARRQSPPRAACTPARAATRTSAAPPRRRRRGSPRRPPPPPPRGAPPRGAPRGPAVGPRAQRGVAQRRRRLCAGARKPAQRALDLGARQASRAERARAAASSASPAIAARPKRKAPCPRPSPRAAPGAPVAAAAAAAGAGRHAGAGISSRAGRLGTPRRAGCRART